MLGMEGQERNRMNRVTWVGGFQLQLEYYNYSYYYYYCYYYYYYKAHIM